MENILFIHGNRGTKFIPLLNHINSDVKSFDLTRFGSIITKLFKAFLFVRKNKKSTTLIIVDDHGFISFFAYAVGKLYSLQYAVRLRGDNWEEIDFENAELKGLGKLRYIRNYFYLKLGEISLKNCELVIPVSQCLANRVTNRLPDISLDKMLVIPVPIECNNYNRINAVTPILNAKNILLVTNFNFRKKISALDEFLPAVSSLLKKYPDLRINIAGDGKHLSEYKEKFVDLPGIKFLGKVNNINEHFSNANIFMHLTYQDGFPNVVVEAMCNKVPIIVNDYCAVMEQIENCKTGFIIHDQEELKIAIEKILDKPNMINSVVEEAYNQVALKYSPKILSHSLSDRLGLHRHAQ